MSSSLPLANTCILLFQHLSPESEQQANHRDDVHFNITPPTRALGTHPETTPSTPMGNELKPSYIYVIKTITCYMVTDPCLLQKRHIHIKDLDSQPDGTLG